MLSQVSARVADIDVAEVFRSDVDDQLKATVRIENESEFPHSAQVVFRGYLRRGNELFYEFLHEQIWVLAPAGETTTKEVAVDVWLTRFPPTMIIDGDIRVEYAVRATVAPWFDNNFMEKKFRVERSLILKNPHAASFPKRQAVNVCVGHGKWGHKTCKPLNGEIWTQKGAYSHGEMIHVGWRLEHEATIQHIAVTLVEVLEYRFSDPGHHMMMKSSRKELSRREQKTNGQDGNFCELEVPKSTNISMPMTLWNVLCIKHELLVQVKTEAQKEAVDIRFPIIIASDAIEGLTNKKAAKNARLPERAIDRDDDSADDDDYDSDLDPDPYENQNRDHSIDLEKVEVKTERSGSLRDAYAQVSFVINSNKPERIPALRVILVGEARADSKWYEFMRFKAIVSTNENTKFNPGERTVKIRLPFRDSQYDTNILAPSIADDIRYVCRATMTSWRLNDVPVETDVYVDRFVDTWAKEAYHGGYNEPYGVNRIKMRQRCFERGKFVFATVEGPFQKIRLELHQQLRFRIPGLEKDGSHCFERTVSVQEFTDNRVYERWLQVPKRIPPSIEISYWNSLVLNYALVLMVTLNDGHEHRHDIPIWIGCTDDRLGPPSMPPPIVPNQMRSVSPEMGELPEFEVVDRDETHYDPWWVERLNDHTYGYDAD